MAEENQQDTTTTEAVSEEKTARSNPSRKTGSTNKTKPKHAWVVRHKFKDQTHIKAVCLDEGTLNKEFPTLVKKGEEYADSKDGNNGVFAELVEVR